MINILKNFYSTSEMTLINEIFSTVTAHNRFLLKTVFKNKKNSMKSLLIPLYNSVNFEKKQFNLEFEVNN